MMSSDRTRAVITGIGIVAPNGTCKTSFWKALMEGRNCVGRMTRFAIDRFASQVSAEIQHFQPHARIPKSHLKYMDRAYQLGVTAAIGAIEDSGLNIMQENTERIGVSMGLAVAGVERGEKGFHTIRDEGIPSLDPHLYQTWFPSACSGYISLLFGIHGQSHVISTGCTSSLDAMGIALDAIRTEQEDVMIVGGSEAPLMPMPFNSFCSMRALSTRNHDAAHASRPFDRERDGFVLGEGAAVLIVESLAHARARSAHIYAEVAGYATTSNAFHMTAPEPTGEQAARCFRLALQDAEISNDKVDYICAHGSSTPLNERVETLAIKKAFGERAYRIPVSSIKSMIGHTLGSAGALQLAACSMALQEQAVPPTINYVYPDPDCDLDVVPNTARDLQANVVIANAAGFSGKNSATVLRAL